MKSSINSSYNIQLTAHVQLQQQQKSYLVYKQKSYNYDKLLVIKNGLESHAQNTP